MELFRFVGLLVRDLFRARVALKAEIVLLRHQLDVLRRNTPKQTRLTRVDRIIFAFLYQLHPEILKSLCIVQPETLVRWHRMGFRMLWRWKSRRRIGRPEINAEIRGLIREMSLANSLWGAPRIQGELKMLGVDVARSTIAKYMIKRRGPSSQGWKTFLCNHADGIASVDFLIVPTIGFKLLYAFVILGHGRRKLLHIGVTDHPTAEWTARQIIEAFPWAEAPDHLIRDNDAIYGVAFKKQLSVMGIRDGPTALRSPWQNGFVERLIGSIRRECLDHLIIFNASHLRCVLKAYAKYYNEARPHLSLETNAPIKRKIMTFGAIKSVPHLGGLHHEYARI